jgi:polar amino acid transport system permease protein
LLTIVSGTAGLALGVAAALMKVSGVAPLRAVADAYLWIIRGTPLLVQVLFVFFALPSIAPWLQMSEFMSACVALSFNVGAYNAEAVRAGLLAVPRGQVDAARALGMNRVWTFTEIVAPQAFRIALPPLVNNVVALLKDSSLAYAIGVVELTNVGNRIQAATFQPVATLTTTALIYLALTTFITKLFGTVEKSLD